MNRQAMLAYEFEEFQRERAVYLECRAEESRLRQELRVRRTLLSVWRLTFKRLGIPLVPPQEPT